MAGERKRKASPPQRRSSPRRVKLENGGASAAVSASASASDRSASKRVRTASVSSEVSLTDEFITFVGKEGNRVCNDDLKVKFGPRYTALVGVLNKLLQTRRIVMLVDGGKTHYQLKTEEEAQKYEGLDQHHMHVLQEVRETGNQGAWVRTIKFKTKLPTAKVNKILKTLVNRKLVKSVTSVASRNRKLYMLFDVEPSEDHTGGPWYTDHEFDDAMVDFARRVIKKCLEKGIDTLGAIKDHIVKRAVLNTSLRDKDMDMLIKTLVLDGSVVQRQGRRELSYEINQSDFFKSSVNPEWNIFAEGKEPPCLGCPLMGECSLRESSVNVQARTGVVCPDTCEYMNSWVECKESLMF